MPRRANGARARDGEPGAVLVSADDQIDEDDLRAAGDMTSEDLHRELENLIVTREPHWPEWLTRQGIYYPSDRELDAEMFPRTCYALNRNEGPALLFDLYHS